MEYLKFSTKDDSTSIKRLFCTPMDKLQRHSMSRELSEIMIALMFGGKSNEFKDSDKPWLYQLIEKRLKMCFNYTLDEKTILFLCVLTGSPGKAVMYLWYLQYWCYENFKTKHITFDMFCKDIFPMGFFSDEDLNKLWDKQKISTLNDKGERVGGSDNLLDYLTAGSCIMF